MTSGTLIVDFDGTISDSRTDIAHAERKAAGPDFIIAEFPGLLPLVE